MILFRQWIYLNQEIQFHETRKKTDFVFAFDVFFEEEKMEWIDANIRRVAVFVEFNNVIFETDLTILKSNSLRVC